MILFRQAARGLWRGKRSYAACILLIMLGVASYVGFTQAGFKLQATMDSMYEAQRFGEAFATVKAIPESGVRALERLDGIDAAAATATADARVLSDGDTVLTLHVMSMDAKDTGAMDRFLLLEGELPDPGRIAVSRLFYEGQGLALGDVIELSCDGRLVKAEISGVVSSPAYIAESGDAAANGYACMPIEAVRTLGNIPNLYNALSFRFTQGVDFDSAEPTLEAALARYGLQSLYGRDDHPSHYAAWSSFESLGESGGMLAAVFLSVAVLVLYILLRRVVQQERTQIGSMKAFGIGNGRILALYIGYGALTGLVGGLLGVAFGIGIAEYFTAVYLTILYMPAITYPPALSVLAGAALLSALAGVVGAIMGAWSVLGLSPAEAMRPPAPPPMKHRSRSRPSTLPLPVSMALRNLSRAKFRSGFIAGGLAVSFAILTFMSSYASIMEDMTMTQFTKVQQYDVKLTLSQPVPRTAAVQSALSLSGVEYAEGLLEVPVTFRNRHLKKEGAVMGMEQAGSLQRLYDSEEYSFLPVPQHGAVISRSLADRLEAKVGDTLMLTTDYTGDDELSIAVSGIISSNDGMVAYMELENLSGLLHTDTAVGAVLLQTSDAAGVKRQLDDARNVSVFTDKVALQSIMQRDLDASLGVNVGIFAIMGLGVAFAVITSTAAISLSERGREYATLRVLGLSPGDIGRTLLLEYLLISLVSLLPGIPLAYGLRWLMRVSMSSESVSMSMHIAPIHFVVGGLVCVLVVLFANISSIRRVAGLEMTDVLKERE